MMPELMLKLTPQQMLEVSRELERLCAFTNKRMTVTERDFFVQELSKGEFSFGAIIKGLQNLHEADLKEITLKRIKESIKTSISWVFTKNDHDCVACQNTGMVSLEDDRGCPFTFGCTCSVGAEWSMQAGAARWQGHFTQVYRGKRLTLNKIIQADLIENSKKRKEPDYADASV
jgi:hypothetical protein